MNQKTAKMIAQFIQRVQLSVQEMPAMQECLNALGEIIEPREVVDDKADSEVASQ